MIQHSSFAVAPWELRETGLDLDVLAQTESIFALSNGHLGLRGNLDEGEPNALPGTYLNGFYEIRSLEHAESAYGDPEAGQAIVNVANGKLLRLLVEGEPFDVRLGELARHERTLDFRAGVLRREAEWTSPGGRTVRVASTRLVSLAKRQIAAIRYEVEPLDGPAEVVVQSELVANEPTTGLRNSDPRTGASLGTPLRAEHASAREHRAVFVHSTERSRLRMASAFDHVVDGPAGTEALPADCDEQLGRLTVAADLEPGKPLRIVKLLAYGWSGRRSVAALRDQVEAALADARHTGWEGLLAAQRAYLDAFWDRADVELDGDPELQQAVRFALFHTLQAGARAERRAIPAKGLTGPGYDGHSFWDTESFVLPVLTYTVPDAARDALRWRHTTLGHARERARELSLHGAAFPWRTIDGVACSSYWPAGTAAFHVGADVAEAVARYQAAVDDPDFERETGLELLVETARLWRSLGHHDEHGRFRIDGVTGPDEYSAVADNNVYTNLMAQRNLRVAADAADRHPERASELGVEPGEPAAWRRAAEAVVVPYDDQLGVHPQSEGFTDHERWDFERTGAEQYPLMLHFPYFDLYRKQVVKQADLVLALHLRGDAFTIEEKARDFAYYDALTVRDSSLSACTQAIVAAEVGHLDLAYDYFGEAALIDLVNLEHNTRDGLHMASLGGAWLVAVAGFGGLRDHGGVLELAPRLPPRLTRLSFGLCFRGRTLRVEVDPRAVRYTLRAGAPLELAHHGERVRVATGEPATRPIPELRAAGPAPSQPAGRAPAARRR